MANSGGVITAPVRVEDVQTVLGESSGDLGTLCSSSKINPFSKYKPVRISGVDASITNSTWWQGTAKNAGLKVNKLYLPTEIIAAYNSGGLMGWVYEAPRGGTSEPYRLTDYSGYNHNATAIYRSWKVESATVAKGNPIEFTATANQDGGDVLSINDIADVAGYKFGVVIQRSDGYTFAVVGDNQDWMNVPTDVLATGVYTAWPILGEFTRGIEDIVAENTYIPLPYLASIVVTIASSGTDRMVVGIGYTIGSGTVSYTLRIAANLSVNYGTLTNVVIATRYRRNGQFDPYEEGEYSRSLADIVYSGSAVSITGSISLDNTGEDMKLVLSYRYGGTQYYEEAYLI